MCGIFIAIANGNSQLNYQSCEEALNYLKKRGRDWHLKSIDNRQLFGKTLL